MIVHLQTWCMDCGCVKVRVVNIHALLFLMNLLQLCQIEQLNVQPSGCKSVHVFDDEGASCFSSRPVSKERDILVSDDALDGIQVRIDVADSTSPSHWSRIVSSLHLVAWTCESMYLDVSWQGSSCFRIYLPQQRK